MGKKGEFSRFPQQTNGEKTASALGVFRAARKLLKQRQVQW